MFPRLSELLIHLAEPVRIPSVDPKITGIVLDSRQVQPGNLFIALSGLNVDGHDFVTDAAERGAAAVVGSRSIHGLSVPYIQVEDGRRAMAYLSAAFYKFPARNLTVIGVTGTDGKTTTAHYIYKILQAAGLQAGLISTVSAFIRDRVLDTGFHVTTPESPDVQRYLAEMVDAGLTHVVIEATSHGLEQERVTACEFDLAIVTNIAHEHLDYHGTYEEYRAAKGRLILSLAQTVEKSIGNLRVAVLNRDDTSYLYLRSLVDNPQNRIGDQKPPRDTQAELDLSVITYGFHPESQVKADRVEQTSSGVRFNVSSPSLQMTIQTPMLGTYNVSNALAAFSAVVVGMGVDPHAAQEGIAALKGIPGRMERLDLGQDFLTIVDFAHTPNALHCALTSARQLTDGRVIVVFGSAGLRDREKRRLMAEISIDLADFSVFTAEDPRTESLDGILVEMAEGAERHGGVEGRTFWRVPDRGKAIRFAIEMAWTGDVVLACGKGHEQSMCFGEVEYPWDDRVAMRAALSDYLGMSGPKMPYLPTSEER